MTTNNIGPVKKAMILLLAVGASLGVLKYTTKYNPETDRVEHITRRTPKLITTLNMTEPTTTVEPEYEDYQNDRPNEDTIDYDIGFDR